MDAWGWPELWALLTSVGFGVISAIFPIANAEAYVIASQVSAIAGTIPIAVGVGSGQAVGKLLLFFGVRRGRELAIVRHRRERVRVRPKGPTRERLDAAVQRLLDLVGTAKWGLPIVFLAAVVGVPPLYAVALLAGATRMRAVWFALVVLVGRVIRFVLVALGALNAAYLF